VALYGSFSPDSQLEKTYSPNYNGDRPLKIIAQGTHTIAVRFSNHQAKNNQKTFSFFLKTLVLVLAFRQLSGQTIQTSDMQIALLRCR
jgi:hypothetical protein